MKRFLPLILVFTVLSVNAHMAYAFDSSRAAEVISAEDSETFSAEVYRLFEENYSESYFSYIAVTEGEDTLERDGETLPMGNSAYIENGEMMLPASAVSEICGVSCFSALDNDLFIPVSEAADELNLEIERSGNEVYITRPYQTMRLIVEASKEPCAYGAATEIKGADGVYILQYKSEEEARRAAELLADDDGVEYVEPDSYIAVEKPVSEYNLSVAEATAHNTWGAEVIGSDKFNEYLTKEYGDALTLPEITVAVVDTGIDYKHPFFEGRIAEGGKDLCGTDTPQDTQSHGSHVSGIIVDLTLPNVKILPIRVLTESTGGSVALLAEGINYATQQGVDVINLSLGVSGTSPSLDRAVKAAYAAGIPSVAAAGNTKVDVSKYSPANVNESIAVSAVDSSDLFASNYSNFGEGIDFCAPGSTVKSAVPGGGFGYKSGTSQAAPHVSAAVAMLKSKYGELTPGEVYDLLYANAIDLGDKGKDNQYGNGRISLLPDIEAYEIDDVSKDGNTISASFANYFKNGRRATAVFASYDNAERMVQAEMFPLNMKKGEKSDLLTAEFDSEPAYYRIFFWSEFNNIVPLCPAEVVLNTGEDA